MELITIHFALSVEYPLESAFYEESLMLFAEQISCRINKENFDKYRTGLYVSTAHAGIFEAMEFWKNALEEGPGFANPANFHWTLANGPASLLSRLLKIKGPCYTLVGMSEAVQGCFFHAFLDIQSGMIDSGIIAGIDLFDNKLHVSFCSCSAAQNQNGLNIHSILTKEEKPLFPYTFLQQIISSH